MASSAERRVSTCRPSKGDLASVGAKRKGGYKEMRTLIALDWARHVESAIPSCNADRHLVFNEMRTNDRAIPRQRRVAGTRTTQEGAAPYETRPTSAAPNRPRTARLLRPVTRPGTGCRVSVMVRLPKGRSSRPGDRGDADGGEGTDAAPPLRRRRDYSSQPALDRLHLSHGLRCVVGAPQAPRPADKRRRAARAEPLGRPGTVASLAGWRWGARCPGRSTRRESSNIDEPP